MRKEKIKLIKLFARYFIIVLVGLGNLAIFYLIFSPLTIYPIYWILGGKLSGSYLAFSDKLIYFSQACIAGAAYYLLFILNFSTKMNLRKRIFSLLFLFFSFLVLNIIRILILIMLYVNQNYFFNITHSISWHFLSTIFVVVIWFINIKLFNVKKIPFYSDVKYILHLKKSQKNYQK